MRTIILYNGFKVMIGYDFEARLRRHVAVHPNDKQAAVALRIQTGA